MNGTAQPGTLVVSLPDKDEFVFTRTFGPSQIKEATDFAKDYDEFLILQLQQAGNQSHKWRILPYGSWGKYQKALALNLI